LQIISPLRRTMILEIFHQIIVPEPSLRAAFQPKAASKGRNFA